VPEPVIAEVGARIMGLDDPTKKMSKSETGQGHAINILDTPDEITHKIKRATTDSLRDIVFDEKRPGVFNLLTIYELLSGLKRDDIVAHFVGKGYGDLKGELAELMVEKLKPLQQKYREVTGDPSYIEDMLMSGADKVRPIAEKVVKTVKDKVGLG
jgi:tryptophanyl-tRNA synthetase